MTKINKIVMHGFKSFAKRTELLFENGFNCVLGPNGSGKSNILDALCFVLGRLSSKSMRAEKAANLVYNGGKVKKPMKQGEVSIHFDNKENTFPTDAEEVKVTRIIKQSGQSIYKINDEKRTRQEILDLLGVARIDPDGFNIVLQGDIVRFTEMRTEDRRLLIEEISGISVYEEKKQKALNELSKVDDKLKQAEIVLSERKGYLKELEKEKNQATKFKELESKIKVNKASYLYRQIEKKQKEKDELTGKINVRKEKLDNLQAKMDGIKKQIDEKKKRIEEINHEVEDKGEKEQVKLHNAVEQLKVKLATDKTRIDNCQGEIDKISIRRKELKNNLEDIEKDLGELNRKKEELEAKKKAKTGEREKITKEIENFKENNEIDNASKIEEQIEEIDKRAEQGQEEIDDLRKSQQELVRKKDSLEFQINNIDEKIEKVKGIEEEHKEQIAELKDKKERFKKSVEELNEGLEADSSLSKQLAEKNQKLVSYEQKLSQLKAKDIAVKEGAGSFTVKKILAKKDSIKGIHGTIGQLGNVSKEYSLALEVAAGPRINSIVVEDDKTAAECIRYLKDNKLGIATFLPLNKIKERKINEDVKRLKDEGGAHGFAIDLVSFDDRFEKVFSYVFGDTLIVDNISSARNIGIGRCRMATLDGDVAEASGAMQGGFRQKKNRAGFNEKELSKDIKEYSSAVSGLKQEVALMSKQKKDTEARIENLRKEKSELEGEIIKSEKSLHIEEGDLEADRNRKKELMQQMEDVEKELNSKGEKLSELNNNIVQDKAKKQEMKNKVSELRNPSLLAELNAFEEQKTSLKEEIVQLDADIKNINTKINDMIMPEKEKIQNIRKQLDKERESFEEEIKKLNDKISQEKEELKSSEEKSQQFYAKYKQLFSERGKISDTIQEDESKIDKLREDSKEIEIKMNNLSIENAKISGELAGLNHDFSQYEGVKINKEKKEEELKREISKFERMASDIGSVNMKSLEIYEDVEKEYNKLLSKKDRLVGEKEDVLNMMNEIEGKKKELFMKTYDSVNSNFQRIFSALSTKGEGSLDLEDPENPLEGGLTIKVRITGTKFLDIRSLSGGEKTMTALAFIFAIQEYSPHSFYVLDEVDAALDKHNSEKLAALVKEYVGKTKSQYVVISHNDSVINEADVLYGISMDEHGVSKAVSLKI
ncbi:chromosome segregation protein SMC [Candidatus Woesearchaeota archaeon]|nr:chromosome segregation protein SMC [Candidatus Woesearchaeota archaeon]